jgi:hypothetical protein
MVACSQGGQNNIKKAPDRGAFSKTKCRKKLVLNKFDDFGFIIAIH